MIKKIAIILMLTMFCACSKTQLEHEIETDMLSTPLSISAEINMEGNLESKTYVDCSLDPMIRWHERDSITVFASSRNEGYVFTGMNGDKSGKFNHACGSTGMMQFSTVYAIYPYDSYTSISEDGIQVMIPSIQRYSPNSFSKNVAVMAAKSEFSSNINFKFRPVLGYIRLRLWNAKGAKVRQITLQANNGVTISGPATIAFAGEYPVSMWMGKDATSNIILDCGSSGVSLGKTANTATDFLIALPPVVLNGGFTIKVKSVDGTIVSKTTNRARLVSMNTINTMAVVECDFPDPVPAEDLSTRGTSNCYIVNKSGTYKFRATKGNSTNSVGQISSVSVLWETFGTDSMPNTGDLVDNVSYSGGYITFNATSKKGNAVIAAMDNSGNILWSWHIWLTDSPQEQTYKNNAGVMMDRNLGATSATPGQPGALGLLYQWGRKDPFLGSSSIKTPKKAQSTGFWPYDIVSDSETGTIQYSIANPMVYIIRNTYNYDWYYTGTLLTDDDRWMSTKTIYDPCPPGWRVPDVGVWTNSLGTNKSWQVQKNWDSINQGVDFGATDKQMASGQTVWYPSTFIYYYYCSELHSTSGVGRYWSCTPCVKNNPNGRNYQVQVLSFDKTACISPYSDYTRGFTNPLRCQKVK